MYIFILYMSSIGWRKLAWWWANGGSSPCIVDWHKVLGLVQRFWALQGEAEISVGGWGPLAPHPSTSALPVSTATVPGPRPAAVEALVLYSGGRVSRGSDRGGVMSAHHRHGIDHLWVRTAMANECEDIGEAEGDGNSWAYHWITILSGTVNSHNVLVTNHRMRERGERF